MRHILPMSFAGCMLAFCATSPAQVPAAAYANFEGRQTNPIRLSPNRSLLFAVNTADARLSVFDATQTPPVLTQEIPVGIEPVSANARTNDEVWVVNELSDSVSIVSVARGIVTDTLHVKDEPADVVFAGGSAFVSVAGSNEIRVFNASNHSPSRTITLAGQRPRAMAVSADERKVYVAFAESGNHTTLIPATLAPPQAAPANPALPAPPQVGLIVDANDPAWKPSVIKFTMPDNDVAEIDVATLSVSRYFSRVGTSNLALAVQPGTGDVFVANTDARNLVHFEPSLRGHCVDNRVTRIPAGGGHFTYSDLNAGLDYSAPPEPGQKANALAQPTSIVFGPGGHHCYVAAFGSDRVAKVGADGEVLARIAISKPGTQSRTMRGPRGLALNAATGTLYVLNRISNTISVVNTATDTVVSEVPIGAFDPTPAAIRNGRGFLYDARLSGNGTLSCASCHLDGNNDRLAWDLGNPAGKMETVRAIKSGEGAGGQFEMHPMKGPMTTQTLKGLRNAGSLHWRGDHADFTSFNPAFESLLGGKELAAAEMAAFRDFIETLRFPPNPEQQLDRTLPPRVAGGDPAVGQNTFINETFTAGTSCNTCHLVPPGSGSDDTLTAGTRLGESQAFKVPHLRNMYQKNSFDDRPGARSLDGFGFSHDGAERTMFDLLGRASFGSFSNDATRKTNLNAFMLCFDTGTAPAVGFTRTASPRNVFTRPVVDDCLLLQSQAAAGNIDLIAKGTLHGRLHGLVYQPAADHYRTDTKGLGPFTREQLQRMIAAGDVLSFTGVPRGSGIRMGIDRDLDGRLDGD